MSRPPILWSAPLESTDYNKCLTRALRAEGYRVERPAWSGSWLWRNLEAGDAFLFHWPSFQYADSKNGVGRNLLGAFKYLLFLLLMRWRGVRIGWIGHNLLPHRRSAPAWLDPLMRRLTIRLCAAVFAHGKGVAGVLAARFPALRRKPPVEIVHGPLAELYPHAMTRATARQRLGLPDDAYVFLMFGLVAPYKGVHLLPPALAGLPPDTHLLIAGRFSDTDYEQRVRELADRHGGARIHIRGGFVADEDVPAYLLACDALVSPYTESLTSGTALLALSFGRPVVAPATPFLREVIGDHAGVLYDEAAGEDLAGALARCRATVFAEEALLAHARAQRWDVTARRIGEALMGK